MRISRTLLLSSVLSLAVVAAAQDSGPAPPVQESAPAPTTTQNAESSSGKKKGIPGYVIIGTVFNENAMSYANARVQIRRENEKKYRWETYSNSRGEFAVRVPEGQEYEVVVKEKKYKDVSVKVSAKAGELQDRLSIRLEPVNQDKGGDKK